MAAASVSAAQAAPAVAPRRSRAGRARLRRFVAPQHGAWAMLLLPYLAGLVVVGPRWPHLPLLVAWLAGYLLSYYLLQAVKTRRPARVRSQLTLYAPITVACGLVVLVAHPELLAFAPAYAVLLAVNAWYAWRRRERALLNDVASVLQSCLMVFVVGVVAGAPPAHLTGVFVTMLGYFLGTVFYVKTMIRERGNPTYRWISVAYHALALAVAVVWLGAPVALVFALLLVRAAVFPGRRLTPKRVGLVEILNCVLLLTGVALTWA